jgi:Tol biopolymer transport system component
MKCKFYGSIILIIALIGCTSNPNPIDILPTISQTPSIATTPTTNREVEPSILTTTSITTPTIPIDHSLEKCLAIKTDNLPNLDSHGFLILSEDPYGYQIYKMNMETKEISETPNSEIPNYDFEISPDQKHIAHESYTLDNEKLIVSDISGKAIKSMPWKEDWSYLAAWLDNQNLIIGITSKDDKTTGKMSSAFIVLNPFTNESKVLQPNFPGIYENYSVAANWSGWRETVYNQTLDRVVYLQGGPSGDGAFHYVLRNLKQGENLASFKVIDGTHSIPRWSPEGNKFVFANSQTENIQKSWPAFELYSVNQEGETTQLTDFTKYYPFFFIDDFSWSPDGRYVAFWFSWWSNRDQAYDLQGERLLAILDTENKVVTNYCIQGAPSRSGRMPPPIWSPDEKQIVVESHDTDGNRKVILLDLENQVAVQIVENLSPLGWMVKP